jgi:SAM-dependent methyltransferase
VQTQDFVLPEDIFIADYAYFSSVSSTWVEHARCFVEQAISRFQLKENSFVVEVAANDGYLLQFLQKKGIRCLGIEPSTKTGNVARALGIEVIDDFFSCELSREITSSYGNADLIIANNVLAHMPDPLSILQGIELLLKDSGVVSIEFHSLKELINKTAIDAVYHEHFSYYTLLSFKALVEKACLKVIDVEEIHTHGGSLRVYLSRFGSLYPVSKQVSRVLEDERAAGLGELQIYRDFFRQAEDIKIKCMNFFSSANNDGLKVVGYGAAAKASTLLNYVKITTEHISFIADKSPIKVGKYLPGCRIPIVDVSELIAFKPDYVVIFPWNIKDEIILELTPVLPKETKFFRLGAEIEELK